MSSVRPRIAFEMAGRDQPCHTPNMKWEDQQVNKTERKAHECSGHARQGRTYTLRVTMPKDENRSYPPTSLREDRPPWRWSTHQQECG